MQVTISADKIHQQKSIAGQDHGRSVLSESASQLGPQGFLRLPNGKTLHEKDLRAIGALPPEKREAELRKLTGYPDLKLQDFESFLDDMVAKNAPGTFKGKAVNLPPA